jgi:hypothetical protein
MFHQSRWMRGHRLVDCQPTARVEKHGANYIAQELYTFRVYIAVHPSLHPSA